MKLRVRVPAWAAADVPIRAKGSAAVTGKPGSYVVLDGEWKAGETIAFTLPMDFRMTRYRGVDGVPGTE